MRKVVVFSSDSVYALGLIRCLGEAGFRPECFVYGDNSSYVLSSRYVSKGHSMEKEEIIDYLVNEYPIYQEKPILLTTPDPPTYLVDSYYHILKEKFFMSSVDGSEGVGHWMNKLNISELARKHGLKTPWAIRLSKNEEIPSTIVYPVFTKSLKSADGGKGDEGICHNREELVKKISTIKGDTFLVMQFVKKQLEINYFGIAIKDRIYIDYNDIRPRFPKDSLGHYNEFVLCNHDETYNNIVGMIKETKYEGLFDVEFLLGDDGNMYFMEVNFRVDGELYKLSKGINMPKEWCKLVELPKDKLPAALPCKKNHFYGMTEIYDFASSVRGDQVGFLKWLWQFFTAKHMLLNWRDPKPALVYFRNAIKEKIH